MQFIKINCGELKKCIYAKITLKLGNLSHLKYYIIYFTYNFKYF